jgi:hypothetical protein
MVQRKFSGVPWQGPLPKPRVSPPRTLGDALAKATHRNSPSTWGSSLSVSRTPVGYSPVTQAEDLKNSKKFENPCFEDVDLNFPPLTVSKAPASTTDGARGVATESDLTPQQNSARLIKPGPGLDPTSSQLHATSLAFVVCDANNAAKEESKSVPDWILLGSGRLFRPTKGLCTLFSRTSARTRRKPKPPV